MRTISPTVGGTMFSWTVVKGMPYPLNYHLPVLFFCAAYVGVALVSYELPKSINQQYVEGA